MKINQTTRSNRRKSLALLLSTTGSVLALTFPGVVAAQNAVNTARVTVPANTFEIDPSNNEATDTDIILAAIVASDDSATGINGAAGGTGVVNAFASDTINGVAASPANAILSVAPGSSVPAGLTFNTATGNVDVAPGTPAGTYSFDYQICEALNPTNCQTATITVTVEAAQITADPDTVAGINGADGAPNLLNVLDGDTLNGNPVTLSEITLTVTTPATPATPGAPVPALNPATGQISVPAGTPAGTYTITYQICEQLNPTNCATNTATVTVNPSVDLVITKSNGTTSVLSGSTTTYTLTVTNNGPDSATGAVVTDTPVAGLTCPAGNPLTIAGPGAPVGAFTFSDLTGAGVVLGTLGNGQSVTISYTCQVN